jgi:DNA repair protein RadC
MGTVFREAVEQAMAAGMASVTDADLVAILLGAGTTGRSVAAVANELLARFGGLEGLWRAGPAAYADHPGVGAVKAMRLGAALELARRYFEQTGRERERLCTSASVAAWFGSQLGKLDHEELWMISLDEYYGLLGARRVAGGAFHGMPLVADDILCSALEDEAASIVLIHNHVTGDPNPSAADFAITAAVAEVAAAVGIPLLDHLIVMADGSYVSLLDPRRRAETDPALS